MEIIKNNLHNINHIAQSPLTSHQSGKVCICFFGLIRYGRKTIPTIKKNVFDQLKAHNIDYDIYLHTYDLKVVNCPRNNEKNVKIDPEEWRDLNPDFHLITSQEDFDNSFDYEWFSRYGWTHGDNNKPSFYNMFRQMNSLKIVTSLWEKEKRHYDLYLYLRPDMEYITPLLVDDLFQHFNNPHAFLLPCWGNTEDGGQYCDCFAIGGIESMRIYGNRIDYAREFIDAGGGKYKKKQFHTESFVFYLAKRFGWKYNEIKWFLGCRVRANGVTFRGFFIDRKLREMKQYYATNK